MRARCLAVRLLLLATVAAALATAAPVAIGIGEQQPIMFSDPL
jgi:hypothetical protein